jgi:hypothetical protein
MIFDVVFENLVNSGLWVMPYFALTDTLHDLTRLSRTRLRLSGSLRRNGHKMSVPLLVCKATYPAALSSFCQKIHPIVDVICQDCGPYPRRPLPQGLGMQHLQLITDLHINIVSVCGDGDIPVPERLDALLEAIDYGSRSKKLTLCFHRKWHPLPVSTIDHLMGSLGRLRTKAKIELDVSLLIDDDIKHLTAGVHQLKVLLGATEVYTCVCLPVTRHFRHVESDNSAG